MISLIQGDSRMIPIKDGSVQCVITSPPYFGLRDYKIHGQIGLESSIDEYLQLIIQVFREIRRVLRPDGTLWLNMGDSYATTPPGRNSPAWGEDGLYRRKRDLQLGHGENRDRIYHKPSELGLKPKDMIGTPWRVAFALQADGWWLRSDIIWAKPNPMPEAVTDRPTKSHEYLFLLAKSKNYYYDQEAIREKFTDDRLVYDRRKLKRIRNVGGRTDGYTTVNGWNNLNKNKGRNKRTVWTIPAAPFKGAHFATFPPDLVLPCMLAGTSEKGCCSICGSPWKRVLSPARYERNNDGGNKVPAKSGKDLITDQTRSSQFTKGGYISGLTKTQDTIGWEPSCSCNGEVIPCVVLDPFSGSGTTGQVAVKYERSFVGIELNPEYLELAMDRIKGAMFPLFDRF